MSIHPPSPCLSGAHLIHGEMLAYASNKLPEETSHDREMTWAVNQLLAEPDNQQTRAVFFKADILLS